MTVLRPCVLITVPVLTAWPSTRASVHLVSVDSPVMLTSMSAPRLRAITTPRVTTPSTQSC